MKMSGLGEPIRTYVKDGEAYIRTDDNKVDGDNLVICRWWMN